MNKIIKIITNEFECEYVITKKTNTKDFGEVTFKNKMTGNLESYEFNFEVPHSVYSEYSNVDKALRKWLETPISIINANQSITINKVTFTKKQ